MSLYNIELNGDVMKIGFGDPAGNDQIVPFVDGVLEEMKVQGKLGGPLLKITGPASLPVAFTIAHAVGHMYGAIACFDPKLGGGKYVVVSSHGSKLKLGDLID